MKKVYIPTEEELYSLQKMGVNVYHYLLSKTIESLIMLDVIYEDEDMFEIAYSDLVEFPEVIYAIASMYPERICDYKKAMGDVDLCRKLISVLKKQESSLYGLDYLTQFSDQVLNDSRIIAETIYVLSREIQNNPRYRFEYKGPNDTLDNIFNGEVATNIITSDIIDDIASLEPAYLAKVTEILEKKKTPENIKSAAKRALIRYSSIYGVDYDDEQKYDSITNQSSKTKKLIRTLENHRQYYQY